jgi:hypothetical protein
MARRHAVFAVIIWCIGCGGGQTGDLLCRPPARPPAGAKCGPVDTTGTPQSQGSSSCGDWGRLITEEPRCCGTAFACCQTDSDCCSGPCIDGVCSSTGSSCGCDGDCSPGASCVAGTCTKLLGTACSMPDECSSGTCGTDGRCTCAEAHDPFIGPPCRSIADCCNGSCTAGQCVRAGEGGPCTTEADCARGACVTGTCQCLPAGSAALADVFNPGCCSGAEGASASADGGLICTAAAGTSSCSPTVPDCFGGSCVGQICVCVGVGGYCHADSDCCGSATHCSLVDPGTGICR